MTDTREAIAWATAGGIAGITIAGTLAAVTYRAGFRAGARGRPVIKRFAGQVGHSRVWRIQQRRAAQNVRDQVSNRWKPRRSRRGGNRSQVVPVST